ncbi:uncharacterized protein [Euwallacea similis]|uniref:uncharacterized protein n=1 Tax=Euwallacea similis TaxID=1736056 RepID=UPI00344F0D88
MEIEKVLSNWQRFQNLKFIMENSFPCTMTSSYYNDFYIGTLSFENQGERRIKFTDGLITVDIPVTSISGSTPEGANIRFTRFDGGWVLLQFPNDRIREIVHQKYLIFEREEHGPTPPSTSSESE